jgi:peroxiredoxin
VDVAGAARELAVFFFYPGTIRPGIPIPAEWSATPGVRGCTVENAGFREGYRELRALGCEVFGVSGQGEIDPERGLSAQRELADRLHLPFELLNDSRFEFARALGIPTFTVRLRSPEFEFRGERHTFVLEGRTLVKRVTLVARHGAVAKVFYPVFPPDQSARFVIDWLRKT